MTSKPVDYVLALDGAWHFGNNIGIFQNATWVGTTLALPFQLAWCAEDEDVVFIIRTTDIETWGASQGHRVCVENHELGRLKDPGDTQPEGTEIHKFTIGAEKLRELAGADGNLLLRIDLEAQDSPGGFSDDFVLRRIETVGAVLRVGWRKK